MVSGICDTERDSSSIEIAIPSDSALITVVSIESIGISADHAPSRIAGNFSNAALRAARVFSSR